MRLFSVSGVASAVLDRGRGHSSAEKNVPGLGSVLILQPTRWDVFPVCHLLWTLHQSITSSINCQAWESSASHPCIRIMIVFRPLAWDSVSMDNSSLNSRRASLQSSGSFFFSSEPSLWSSIACQKVHANQISNGTASAHNQEDRSRLGEFGISLSPIRIIRGGLEGVRAGDDGVSGRTANHNVADSARASLFCMFLLDPFFLFFASIL